MKPVLLFFTFAVVIAAPAQKPPVDQLEQLKKLDWLVGTWTGEGWIEFQPGQRRDFSQTELVQKKAGGTVLLIEGIGKTKIASTNSAVTVLEAITLVSYDPRKERFRWYSHTDRGYLTDIEPKVGDRTLQWAVDAPGIGTMRYTIRLNEKGAWFEIGEMSKNGVDWRKFFEMTLRQSRSAGAEF
jgi:hypothetical protein